MKSPILGQSYVARSINAANNRMVNLFPESIASEGKEQGFLSRAPGLRLLGTLGAGPIRGLWAFGSYFYAVSGSYFYRVDQNADSVVIGSVSDGFFGGDNYPVSMADNGTQLFIACNGPSYIYNSVTNEFGPITDPDFVGAKTVGYLDGYFVFSEPNSQRFWLTQLLDGTSINPLDYASAEGMPDGLVSLIIDHRELWLLGNNTVEVWYDSGATNFPLERIQGAFNEYGCAAPFSVAKLDNGLFWLGSDVRGRGMVFRSSGYTGVRVSTHAVEYAIAQYDFIGDAIAYAYQQEGHSFYVLIFPAADATWCYDVSTQMWHERASFYEGSFIRHRSSCHVAFNGLNIVGDFENGNLYALDLNSYADDALTQKWLRSWRALSPTQNTLKRTVQHSLQLDVETGVGLSGLIEETLAMVSEDAITLITEDGIPIITEYVEIRGIDPQVMLRWSDDGGHTWSNEHWKSIGKQGEYGHRVIWRRLGMTDKLRDRVYEISGTDPVRITIMGAELNAGATNA